MLKKDVRVLPAGLLLDLFGPAVEGRVIVGRPPKPQVPPRGSGDQRRTGALGLVFVNGHQRDVMAPKKVVHFLIEPGAMPELEGSRPAPGQPGQETPQSVCVLL